MRAEEGVFVPNRFRFFFLVISGLYPLVIFHHNPTRLNRRRQIDLRDACIRRRKMIPK